MPYPPHPTTTRELSGHALTLLEKRGIVPQPIAIHSSDAALLDRCRFQFFLQRRLGLVPAFSISKALSHGKWLHKAFEQIDAPEADLRSHMARALKARTAELRGYGKALSLSTGTIAKEVAEEKHEAAEALAWILASRAFHLPKNKFLAQGWGGFLSPKKWRTLGSEVRILHKLPDIHTPAVIAIDKLLLNRKTNRLWIVDAKSTSFPTVQRAKQVRAEFQPIHYLYTAQVALDSGLLHSHYELPANTTLGGVIHIIIRKPSIRFGSKDRDYVWHSAGKRSGVEGFALLKKGPIRTHWVVYLYDFDNAVGTPNRVLSAPGFESPWAEGYAREKLYESTGKKPEKRYNDEPNVANYQRRCLDWYTARGDYADNAEEWEQSPPVNIVRSPSNFLLDPRRMRSYHWQLKRLDHFSTIDPIPGNFDETAAGIEAEDFRYEEFYVNPVSHWPGIIVKQRLVQQFRDENIDPKADNTIS